MEELFDYAPRARNASIQWISDKESTPCHVENCLRVNDLPFSNQTCQSKRSAVHTHDVPAATMSPQRPDAMRCDKKRAKLIRKTNIALDRHLHGELFRGREAWHGIIIASLHLHPIKRWVK